MDPALMQIPAELEAKPLSLLEQAQTVAILNNEAFLVANDLDAGLTAMEREIVAFFREPKQKAHEAHKSIVAAEAKALDPVKRARDLLKPKIGNYLREQERIRQEQERKLQEEARLREEEQRIAEAAELEKQGKREEAEAVISEPIIVPTVTAPRVVPQVKGLSMRENWKAQLVDLRALVKAVAEGKVPIQALCANEVFLNGQARAMKGDLNYPGVKAVSDVGIARRA